MLLGPAFATHKVLKMAGIGLADLGVIEFHEAFAGQVLANLNALNSDAFYKEKLPGQAKVGEVPMDKFNTLGGSLSILRAAVQWVAIQDPSSLQVLT